MRVRRTDIILTAALVGVLGFALWLAIEDRAIMALPLVIVTAGLVRTLVRRAQPERFSPAAMDSHPPTDGQGQGRRGP